VDFNDCNSKVYGQRMRRAQTNWGQCDTCTNTPLLQLFPYQPWTRDAQWNNQTWSYCYWISGTDKYEKGRI